eukprot:536430-Hanusia_phi.AAC.3
MYQRQNVLTDFTQLYTSNLSFSMHPSICLSIYSRLPLYRAAFSCDPLTPADYPTCPTAEKHY